MAQAYRTIKHVSSVDIHWYFVLLISCPPAFLKKWNDEWIYVALLQFLTTQSDLQYKQKFTRSHWYSKTNCMGFHIGPTCSLETDIN